MWADCVSHGKERTGMKKHKGKKGFIIFFRVIDEKTGQAIVKMDNRLTDEVVEMVKEAMRKLQ